jgi:hypothetical protein
VVILVIEPFVYWTLLGLLISNLIAAVLKTWFLRRALREQEVPPTCADTGAPKWPGNCWNVRCQLGNTCCRERKEPADAA